ncbi:MAG: prolyl oligopeptidase family serine peptidase, partial [Niabella sp.]
RFKQVDGTLSQGILYRPQDFDPAKKYPVIIRYYYQFSHLLHEFPTPDYIYSAHLDVASLVSRGYLVLAPDIYFTADRPRPASAWNTVEGAGRYLKTLPYVDSTRMGISGHSRAGGYTNYIITHSTQFAAAFEGAGVSDWVSAQLQLVFNSGYPRPAIGQEPYIYANKQFIMDNPILHADKITTPLLIFHNKLDAAVPFEQGVELYIAMRRLGKKVWMLQYDDGEGHSVVLPKNKEDLTIRVTQFFDHYLKGAPAPKWMTTGVPAKLKGIETGLEFDNSGRKP